MKTWRLYLCTFAMCLTALTAAPAGAQAFPNKPLRIIVPFAAGANSDVIIRMIAQRVTDGGGPTVIIDNRPGGGGVIGAMAAKQAQPDGYTLFAANIATQSILPSMQELAYDPVKDFRPITQLFYFPTYLIVPARIPANTVGELMALAKRSPDGLSFGSQGIGSTPHLLGAMLQNASGAKLVHIPYPGGGGPMNIDVTAGRLDMVFSTYASLKQQRDQGKVKFLAIASSRRSAVAPELPTLSEAGFPGIELDSWFGLVAPAGTPDAVIAALHRLFVQAAQAPDIVGKLREQGITVATLAPRDFAALIERDAERLGKVAKAAGIRLN